MKIIESKILMKILISEEDKVDGKPLYKEIVDIVKEEKISGITVLRGITGFGENRHMHTFSILNLSEDLPIIIEIIDSKETIKKLEQKFDKFIKKAVITKNEIEVITYTQKC